MQTIALEDLTKHQGELIGRSEVQLRYPQPGGTAERQRGGPATGTRKLPHHH